MQDSGIIPGKKQKADLDSGETKKTYSFTGANRSLLPYLHSHG
jgi:hypothetical protein